MWIELGLLACPSFLDWHIGQGLKFRGSDNPQLPLLAGEMKIVWGWSMDGIPMMKVDPVADEKGT
jgi:hypothetical protein